MPATYGSTAARIAANSMPVPFCGCWIWTGGVNSSGYGKYAVRINRRYPAWHPRAGERIIKNRLAHRVSLADALGVAYSQLRVVAHSCDVRLCDCASIRRIFETEPSANVRDCVAKGRHVSGFVRFDPSYPPDTEPGEFDPDDDSYMKPGISQ